MYKGLKIKLKQRKWRRGTCSSTDLKWENVYEGQCTDWETVYHVHWVYFMIWVLSLPLLQLEKDVIVFCYYKYKSASILMMLFSLFHFHCSRSGNEVTFTINGKKYTGNLSF